MDSSPVFRLLCQVLITAFQGSLFVYGQATSTTPAVAPQSHEEEESKPFPTWLIGVIVLSSLLVIGIIVTIVQRVLRKRNERMEEYRLQAD